MVIGTPINKVRTIFKFEGNNREIITGSAVINTKRYKKMVLLSKDYNPDGTIQKVVQTKEGVKAAK